MGMFGLSALDFWVLSLPDDYGPKGCVCVCGGLQEAAILLVVTSLLVFLVGRRVPYGDMQTCSFT